MTDQIVDAYGVRFTTDAWAAFTWRQIWTTIVLVAGVTCLIGGIAAIVVAVFSTPSQPIENPEQVAYSTMYLGISVLLSALGSVLVRVGASFYPIPWDYSLSIQDQLAIEAQEVEQR